MWINLFYLTRMCLKSRYYDADVSFRHILYILHMLYRYTPAIYCTPHDLYLYSFINYISSITEIRRKVTYVYIYKTYIEPFSALTSNSLWQRKLINTAYFCLIYSLRKWSQCDQILSLYSNSKIKSNDHMLGKRRWLQSILTTQGFARNHE